MPVVDMPIEQLENYKGVSPKPADFDEYWEKALAEMNATDPQVELIKADFESTRPNRPQTA